MPLTFFSSLYGFHELQLGFPAPQVSSSRSVSTRVDRLKLAPIDEVLQLHEHEPTDLKSYGSLSAAAASSAWTARRGRTTVVTCGRMNLRFRNGEHPEPAKPGDWGHHGSVPTQQEVVEKLSIQVSGLGV